MISAGYLVFVQFVFLVSSVGIPVHSLRVDFVSGTNIVAISSYCALKLGLTIRHSRLKKNVRIILHETIATTLLALVIGTYYANPPKPSSSNESDDDYYQDIAVWLLIQLVAYNVIGCPYIYTYRKKKIISTRILILVLLSLISSSLHFFKQISSTLLHFLGQYHGYIRVLLCLDSLRDLPLAPNLLSRC